MLWPKVRYRLKHQLKCLLLRRQYGVKTIATMGKVTSRRARWVVVFILLTALIFFLSKVFNYTAEHHQQPSYIGGGETTRYNVNGNFVFKPRDLSDVKLLRQQPPSTLCKDIKQQYGLRLEQGQWWVKVQGQLVDRVTVYNCALDTLRDNLLAKNANNSWTGFPSPSGIGTMYGDKDNYLRHLQDHPDDVTTLFLDWEGENPTGTWNSRTDSSNVVIKEYFEGTASAPFCDWWHDSAMKFLIEKYGFCHKDRSDGLQPKSLDSSHVVRQNYDPLDNFYVSFIHALRNVGINERGDVISTSFTIRGPSCERHFKLEQPKYSDVIHDEVFVISQYYGNEFFHRMCEDMPRLAPYLDFLRKHSHVKIHMKGERNVQTDGMLAHLGIDPGRIVSGNVLARLAYFPRSTACCHSLVQESQLLSLAYRQVITTQYSDLDWNTVLYITRSGKRPFLREPPIREAVKQLAEEYKFRFEIFPDNPVPPIAETMAMFYRAKVIVTPHGAGLSNFLFTRPGSYVIEGICHAPLVNSCFLESSYVLGHHYHAIPSRTYGTDLLDIDVNEIKASLKFYLETIRKSNPN